MTTQNTTISLDALESLANQIVADDSTARSNLRRMIRAEARILAVREPGKFKSRPTIYADEDGHWDNSYPPSQEFKQPTGPRAILVRKTEFESRATSGGFYHDLAYFTTAPGLSIDRHGDILLSTLIGTGHFGQFAAHPGETGVDCQIEYDVAGSEDLTTSDLREIESELRALAFPLTAAKARKGGE